MPCVCVWVNEAACTHVKAQISQLDSNSLFWRSLKKWHGSSQNNSHHNFWKFEGFLVVQFVQSTLCFQQLAGTSGLVPPVAGMSHASHFYSIYQYLSISCIKPWGCYDCSPELQPVNPPGPVQNLHVETSPELVQLPETCPSHLGILSQFNTKLTPMATGTPSKQIEHVLCIALRRCASTSRTVCQVSSSCNPTRMKWNAWILQWMYDDHAHICGDTWHSTTLARLNHRSTWAQTHTHHLKKLND